MLFRVQRKNAGNAQAVNNNDYTTTTLPVSIGWSKKAGKRTTEVTVHGYVRIYCAHSPNTVTEGDISK